MEWNSIETYRDGLVMVTWLNDGVRNYSLARKTGRYSNKKEWIDICGDSIEPTHWISIPEFKESEVN